MELNKDDVDSCSSSVDDVVIIPSSPDEIMPQQQQQQPQPQTQPQPHALRFEDLLKSFFAEEERDLSCDKCKQPGARAKVRLIFHKITIPYTLQLLHIFAILFLL